MTKAKLLIIIAALLCAVTAVAGVTVALLTSVAGPVENVFTIGNITISLTETTGDSYQLIPGKTVEKNPKVLVKGGSEDCWLFIKVTKSQGFDDYVTSVIDSDWTHLGGYDGVYYRKVIRSGADQEFSILDGDAITVREDLTEEKMSAILVFPKINFEAYAIQCHGIESAYDAWQQILTEVNE